jgi:hypothetical protein
MAAILLIGLLLPLFILGFFIIGLIEFLAY